MEGGTMFFRMHTSSVIAYPDGGIPIDLEYSTYSVDVRKSVTAIGGVLVEDIAPSSDGWVAKSFADVKHFDEKLSGFDIIEAVVGTGACAIRVARRMRDRGFSFCDDKGIRAINTLCAIIRLCGVKAAKRYAAGLKGIRNRQTYRMIVNGHAVIAPGSVAAAWVEKVLPFLVANCRDMFASAPKMNVRKWRDGYTSDGAYDSSRYLETAGPSGCRYIGLSECAFEQPEATPEMLIRAYCVIAGFEPGELEESELKRMAYAAVIEAVYALKGKHSAPVATLPWQRHALRSGAFKTSATNATFIRTAWLNAYGRAVRAVVRNRLGIPADAEILNVGGLDIISMEIVDAPLDFCSDDAKFIVGAHAANRPDAPEFTARL